MVAVNQTRSQKEGVFRNKKYYLQVTNYEVYILMGVFYRITNVWIVK